MTAVVAIIVLVVMFTNPIRDFYWDFIIFIFILYNILPSIILVSSSLSVLGEVLKIRFTDTILAFFDKSAISKVVAS